jgi:hypothetical protein
MSSENEPETRKLTVAELLGQHGGGQAADGVTGRRRRGEDAAEETAPQAIIERVRGTEPKPGPGSEPATDGEAPGSGPSRPAERPRLAEPVTRHLPAVTEDEPAEQDGAPAGQGGMAAGPQPAVEDAPADAESRDAAAGTDGGEPAEGSSAVREWFGLVGAIVGGVVGGAAVWLLFNWLWGRAWVIALVVAVLVVAGAVIGVRSLWRLRDWVTLVLTAVAGLVATVSPAILLTLRR